MQAHSRPSIKRLHHPSQWVNIFPQHKERVATASDFSVQLTTNFASQHLARLNRIPHRMDDFLIVRCLNGNDSFATINCVYKPSIIGFSLKALATLDTSFEHSDREQLERVEHDIDAFERQLGSHVTTYVRDYSNQLQKFNVEKLGLGDVDKSTRMKKSSSTHSQMTQATSTFKSVAQSRLDIYKNCLHELRDKIIDDDPHFSRPLSAEYAFLMRHLTDRCYKLLEQLPPLPPTTQQQDQELLVDLATDKRRSSVEFASPRLTSTNTLAIEEQKSLVLRLLSSREFDEFANADFDLELLAEVCQKPLTPSSSSLSSPS